MADAFRKSGRGGAGNFWSKKDVEEVEKRAAAQDLEAQRRTADPYHPAETAPGYARAGRGGAGNFIDQKTLPDAKAIEEQAEKTLAVVAASIAKPTVGWSGRGGAGNYSDAPSASHEADQRTRAALEQKVLLDVDAELAMPPKAHTSSARGDSA